MERLDEDDDITEEEHVSHALQRFAAGGHPRSDSPDGTVPTEYLQQDHDETLELPAHQDQRPGACFLCMAAFPVVTLLAIVALSFGAGLWVLATLHTPCVDREQNFAARRPLHCTPHRRGFQLKLS